VRIVAGLYRGRRIEAPPGRNTRPTADRVREALFSILGDVEGLHALDLFAGSGALGIEALSRGAASATFVDSDARAAATVRRNLESIQAEAAVYKRDALAWLTQAKARRQAYDLVFLDPPYDSASRVARALSERLPPVLSEISLIVTESDKRAPLDVALPLADERVYGDTRIAIHRGR
jgi:16S rRNA (guanine(966)-N(2))-methyltransferase RsmD